MLLIDEVDRVEVETEALLLEILSDYQVSIPELGTITAKQIPLVFLTSNNTRELSEALKRRCLFLHVDYPDLEREKEIVLTKVPGHHREPRRPGRPHRALDPPARAEEGAVGVARPSTGPARCCCSASSTIDEQTAKETLNILLKYQTDIAKAAKELSRRQQLTSCAVATASRHASMLDLLNGFIVELRNAGLPVSLTENLDAMEAVQHIPIEDREAFKYALGATLVKNNAHWRAFETVFEVYFSLRGPEYKLVQDGDDDRPRRAVARAAGAAAARARARAARAAARQPDARRDRRRCSVRR